MISVVKKAEHFYFMVNGFFFKVNDRKASIGTSLINCQNSHLKLSYGFFFHEVSLTTFLPPVFLVLRVIQY